MSSRVATARPAARLSTSTPRPAGSPASSVRTPLQPSAAAVGVDRSRGLSQARGPAGGALVQAARRVQPDGSSTPAERVAGVVCASAGNHAQGFAFACRTLGVVRPDLPAPVHAAAEARPDPVPRRRVGRADPRSAPPTTTRPRPRPDDAADRRDAGAAVRRPADIAGQGTVATEIVEQLGRAPDAVHGAGRRRRAGRRDVHLLRERRPRSSWSASSRPGRRR